MYKLKLEQQKQKSYYFCLNLLQTIVLSRSVAKENRMEEMIIFCVGLDEKILRK